MSKEEDDHVSFSSFDPDFVSRRVYGRERSVWSCGVVEWIGRPLISPTPSPGHRQVTVMVLSIPILWYVFFPQILDSRHCARCILSARDVVPDGHASHDIVLSVLIEGYVSFSQSSN